MSQNSLAHKMSEYLYADEAQCVEEMLDTLEWNDDMKARVENRARDLVTKVRDSKRKRGELESFLQQYGLNTEEGLALMTLAEALLRIPDAHTANALIRDKMAAAEWLGKQGDTKALTRFYLDTTWDGEEMLLQARAMDETGYVQPTKAQLREVRGENSIYHNNCIQTWYVNGEGIAENVEVS